MAETMQIEDTNGIKNTSGAPARKGPRGEVFLYARWCKGCHICVSFCPTGVLEMHESGNFPIVVQPEKCTACHFCDTHCPDLAIVVRRV